MELSVVIPMFNAERTIRKTLDSVISQSFKPYEILIVNDGSTDSSVKLIDDLLDRQYESDFLKSDPSVQLPKLRVIEQSNKGEGSARNLGIRNAECEWVALLDADDLWYPDHLATINHLIKTFPDASLVSTSSIRATLDDVGLSMPPRNTQIDEIGIIEYFAEASKNIEVLNSSTSAVRKETIEELGGFKSFEAGTDLEMWAQIALNFRVAHSKRITVVYVQHPNSVMSQLTRLGASSQTPIQRLEDLSPSSAVVVKAMADERHYTKQKYLKQYLNSRLSSAVKFLLSNGRFSEARAAGRLALSPRPVFLLVISYSPMLLMRFAVRVRQAIRQSGN